MRNKKLIYPAILLFSFLLSHGVMAQQTKERHRSVTIKRVVVNGKVVQSDTTVSTNDTVSRDVHSREVSRELPYTKGTTVQIENRYRKINIRRSGDNKVRLSTTAFYNGTSTFTDEQWLDRLNIKMQKSDSGIHITSGSAGPHTKSTSTTSESSSSQEVTTSPSSASGSSTTTRTVTTDRSSAVGIGSGNSAAVYDEQGAFSYYTNSLKQELNLYLPADAKLDLSTMYADVSADHDLTDIHITLTNAALDMVNAGNAVIFSNYSNISAGNIVNGRITISSGKLSVKNVGLLQLDSRHAKVDAAKCDSLQIRSLSDDYDIEEARSLVATKSFGSLTIARLTGSLYLKGSSADVKVRRIDPSVSSINIDDRYADIALPVTALKNYSIAFNGDYSSVFAPFEKKETTGGQPDEPTVATASASGGSGGTAVSTSISPSRKNSQSFTAVAGDMKESPTLFKLACSSCSVDFK